MDTISKHFSICLYWAISLAFYELYLPNLHRESISSWSLKIEHFHLNTAITLEAIAVKNGYSKWPQNRNISTLIFILPYLRYFTRYIDINHTVNWSPWSFKNTSNLFKSINYFRSSGPRIWLLKTHTLSKDFSTCLYWAISLAFYKLYPPNLHRVAMICCSFKIN